MSTPDQSPIIAPTPPPPLPAGTPVPFVNRHDRRLELRLLAAYYTRCVDTWRFRQVRDDFSRLYCLQYGEAEIRIRGQRLVLVPGALYLLRLHESGDYLCPEAMGLHWAHFRIEIMPGVDLFEHVLPPLAVPAPPDLLATMRQVEAIDQPDATPQVHVQAMAALAALVAPFLPTTWGELLPTSLARLQPALARLSERYADPRLGLDDLAAACGYHPTYFSNLFAEVNGIAPMRYVARYRLDKAKQLLLQTDGRCDDIARHCGFGDAAYFSRVFRRHEGRSPTAYRREFAGSRP